MDEMFAQVRDVFEKNNLLTERVVIEQDKVLVKLVALAEREVIAMIDESRGLIGSFVRPFHFFFSRKIAQL